MLDGLYPNGPVLERCRDYHWQFMIVLQVEKHHGYQYEHCFSKNWNVMKGYHFLKRLGHLINTITQKTERLAQIVRQRGLRGLIQFIRETCKGPWLDAERIQQLRASSLQLRLE